MYYVSAVINTFLIYYKFQQNTQVYPFGGARPNTKTANAKNTKISLTFSIFIFYVCLRRDGWIRLLKGSLLIIAYLNMNGNLIEKSGQSTSVPVCVTLAQNT